MSNARTIVGGEALVDLILRPDGSTSAVLGGGPFNTARTIARLGGSVAFASSISKDRFGRQFVEALEADGVDTDLLHRTEAPTTISLAEIDDHGSAQYRFYIDGTSSRALGVIDLGEAPAALHIGTLGLVLEPMAIHLASLALHAQADTLVMVDVNCRPLVIQRPAAYLALLAEVLAHTNVVKVSSEDLAFLATIDGSLDRPESLLDLGPTVVLLTDGARGVDIITTDFEAHVDAEPVTVVDTIGAGDSFGGAFIARWRQRDRGVDQLGDMAALSDAVAIGCRVAGITCSRSGADPPHADEVPGWD